MPAPQPEPIPNITINNYYGGGPTRHRDRDYRLGHFSGNHRGYKKPNSIQTQAVEQPFHILSQDKIKSLSRGQKRRYFKRLAANQPAAQGAQRTNH